MMPSVTISVPVTKRRHLGEGGEAAQNGGWYVGMVCCCVCRQRLSHHLCSGGIRQKPARNASNFFIKLLTHFVYNSHGITLFGLCVMALRICDMNVWKV